MGLYRGVCATSGAVGVEKCVALGIYKGCLPEKRAPTTLESVGASALAGFASGSTQGPVEAVKVRAMTLHSEASEMGRGWRSVIGMELKALSTLGVRDIMKSTAISSLRDSYSTVWFLVPYELVKSTVKRWQQPGSSNTFPAVVAGVVSGPISWLSIYPVEIYRIHTFTAGAAQGAPGRGLVNVLADVQRIHRSGGGGLRGCRVWFRGFAGMFFFSCLKYPVTMAVFENVHDLIG